MASIAPRPPVGQQQAGSLSLPAGTTIIQQGVTAQQSNVPGFALVPAQYVHQVCNACLLSLRQSSVVHNAYPVLGISQIGLEL